MKRFVFRGELVLTPVDEISGLVDASQGKTIGVVRVFAA